MLALGVEPDFNLGKCTTVSYRLFF